MSTQEITRLDSNGTITREWMVGHASPATAQEVVMSRVKLYSHTVGVGPWKWLYVYRADGGPEREGGTGLTETMHRMRRVFPVASIRQDWK